MQAAPGQLELFDDPMAEPRWREHLGELLRGYDGWLPLVQATLEGLGAGLVGTFLLGEPARAGDPPLALGRSTDLHRDLVLWRGRYGRVALRYYTDERQA